MLTCFSNTDHQKEVLSRIPMVKHSLYISTADIIGLYVEIVKQGNSRCKSVYSAYRNM